MKEIVQRLQEKRNIEVAKSILEDQGYKVSKNSKRLRESTSNYTLDELKLLLEIDSELDYALELIAMPRVDETPFAWDPTIDIEGDFVVISGSISPGGGGGDVGSVRISATVEVFQEFYRLCINHSEQSLADLGLSEEDQRFVWSICETY